MAAPNSADTSVSFKDTLNLPRTEFPIRPQPNVDDPAMVKRWESEQLFRKTYEIHEGKETFILHDGPPYSNGHIHIGHAYNKILKDIVGKSQRMLGKQVPIKPGWDCHGLPIEKKVTTEQPGLDPVELKKACRAYAQKWIDIQKEEFKGLGVCMDWDRPYTTMSKEYEASILRAFGIFIADGYIERKNKTVPWCPTDKTVLAAAEIEYQERKDPSIYVLFQLDPAQADALFPSLAGQEINFLVWTTTPWTLPLNRAVLLRPATEYVIIRCKGTHIIVAKALAHAIAAMVGCEPDIVAEFNSTELYAAGPKAIHPFVQGLKVPVLLDDSVELGEGTACVHCAPGCGPQDYEVGVKNNLEIFSPVSDDGRYTARIEPAELRDMPVADGQIWVIKQLAANHRLFYKTTIKHSYPHCWRCHNGLIYRATRQWFCDLAKGDLKNRALAATATIVTIPEASINRLRATLEGRLEWCLSRQRVWGAPIPALLCTKCDYTYITQGLVDRVADSVAQEGIEYWDTADAQELLPKGFACPLCLNTEFKKETDILDVWFESGISHYAVLHKAPQRFPADMYLEGSDQHRAWFQSSLLTAMVIEKQAPMNLIYTHGFVVDEHGRKMSKSLGNVVAPQDIIAKYGTDVLRLWASSLDCSGDAVVSETLLKNVAQVYGKIRNTCRFLLSNLYDFSMQKDAVPVDKMLILDQYAMRQLVDLNNRVQQQYQDVDVTAIFHTLGNYCAVDLSAFYLDIIKDRLYVEKADGLKRRSAQTACWYILDCLTKLMAPILSFSAEAISDHYQLDKRDSIHLQTFASLEPLVVWLEQQANTPHGLPARGPKESKPKEQTALELYQAEQVYQWDMLKSMRSAVLKAIEGLREQGIVKLPLEIRVTMSLDDTLRDDLKLFFMELSSHEQSVEQFFKEFFIVSQVEILTHATQLPETTIKGFRLKVEHARGVKCPRCWQWHEDAHPYNLCSRCAAIVG